MNKISRIERIKDLKILIYGDYMVDAYLNGQVKRISPEAPVPVLHVTDKKKKLGGAGNVVENIQALGASTRLIGYVGNDEEGNWAIEKFKKIGADVRYLTKYDDYRTISKTRITAQKQQFIRCDIEDIVDAPDAYCEFMKDREKQYFEDIDLLIISDYGKGAVTEEICQNLIKAAKEKRIPIFVDPKGKNYRKYSGATVCTPNMSELRLVMNEKIQDEEQLVKIGEKARNNFGLDNLAVTRSEKGITVFTEGGVGNYPAISKDVIDVSGAGDTVVATMACAFGCGFSIDECCKLANLAASVVCSKFGTATITLNELMEQIVGSGKYKYIGLADAKYIVANLKDKHKKVVFTNGCFDLLHAGHLSSLVTAKQQGDILIVAVNSDASVQKIKGESRPIIEEKYRIEMLCALECVDYVILMDDNNPIHIIEQLQPDITIKGKDWESKYLPEREVVESYGGEVRFVELKDTLSTTNIIKKISRQM